jgi:Mce-associated membrane protein
MARHVAPAGTKLTAETDPSPDLEDSSAETTDSAPAPTFGSDVASESETGITADEHTEEAETGVEDFQAVSTDTESGDQETADDADAGSRRRRPLASPTAVGALLGAATIVGLGALGGWLGWQALNEHRMQQDRALFLQVGRQGALDLTTISANTVEADVQRIVDLSTGAFRDSFQQRSQSFIDVVKQAQSQSQGSITEAGLESVNGGEAQVLVAVTVKTSNAGAPERNPRDWRMRIVVHKEKDDVKVSNVEFVP